MFINLYMVQVAGKKAFLSVCDDDNCGERGKELGALTVSDLHVQAFKRYSAVGRGVHDAQQCQPRSTSLKPRCCVVINTDSSEGEPRINCVLIAHNCTFEAVEG